MARGTCKQQPQESCVKPVFQPRLRPVGTPPPDDAGTPGGKDVAAEFLAMYILHAPAQDPPSNMESRDTLESRVVFI